MLKTPFKWFKVFACLFTCVFPFLKSNSMMAVATIKNGLVTSYMYTNVMAYIVKL